MNDLSAINYPPILKKRKLTLIFSWFTMFANAQSIEIDLIIAYVGIVDVMKKAHIPNQTICIDGDIIVAAGSGKAISKGFTSRQTINANGKFIMPSLRDMLVHFGVGFICQYIQTGRNESTQYK